MSDIPYDKNSGAAPEGGQASESNRAPPSRGVRTPSGAPGAPTSGGPSRAADSNSVGAKGAGLSESEEDGTTNPSTPPLPLVARRVIKLNESSRPPSPRMTPVVESKEADLDDLSEHLSSTEIDRLSSRDAERPRRVPTDPEIPGDAALPSASSLGVGEVPATVTPSAASSDPRTTSSLPPSGPPRPKTSLPPAGRAGLRSPSPPRRNVAPTPPPPRREGESSPPPAQTNSVAAASSSSRGPLASGEALGQPPATVQPSAHPGMASAPAPMVAPGPQGAPPGPQGPPSGPQGAPSGPQGAPPAPSRKAAVQDTSGDSSASIDQGERQAHADVISSASSEPAGSFDDTTPIPVSVELESGPEAVAATSPPDSVPPDSVEEVDAVEDMSEALEAPEPEVPPADRKPPPPRRSAAPSLPKVQKPRKKPWWETLFGDDFSRAYRPMTPTQLGREVDFMQSALGLPPGAVILDLGCGQGEICVELARRGYSMVGYDLSVFQLAMAGDNAQSSHQKINFLQGDMREMAFEQMFDAVVSWDTSFGYFEEEKNIDVLKRIKNALKPGGRLLLDVLNRDFVAREAPYNHWFEGDGCVCMDDMSMDWITNRLKVKRSIILDDGRSKELQYSVRLYGLSDVGRMLHDVGFRVSAISGDVCTPGAFFGPSSRRIIITANKP